MLRIEDCECVLLTIGIDDPQEVQQSAISGHVKPSRWRGRCGRRGLVVVHERLQLFVAAKEVAHALQCVRV